MVFTSAALLTGQIEVVATKAGAPQCVVLDGLGAGVTVLHVGDKAEFDANELPDMLTPNAARVVKASSKPGATESFGGLSSRHVIVVLTAVAPGSVSFSWRDCSGTGC